MNRRVEFDIQTQACTGNGCEPIFESQRRRIEEGDECCLAIVGHAMLVMHTMRGVTLAHRGPERGASIASNGARALTGIAWREHPSQRHSGVAHARKDGLDAGRHGNFRQDQA